jgi:hypothetical protein
MLRNSGIQSTILYRHYTFNSSSLSKTLKMKIHISIILPVLYGSATWSLTMREEHRLNFLIDGPKIFVVSS